MAVTTWSFASDYEGWTFTDISPDPSCSATRSYVSGAMRTTLVVASLPNVTAWGEHTSPTSLGVVVVNGDTVAVDYSATSDAPNNTRIGLEAVYTDATSESNNVVSSAAGTLTLTMTQAKELDYILVQDSRSTSGSASGSTNYRDILEVRLTTTNTPPPIDGEGEKLLGLDVDTETCAKRWVTFWDDGALKIREYNNALAVQSTYSLVASGVATYELDDRTYWVSPFAPAFFGTASLADIVYVYGRWDDGTLRHIMKSTDAASSFSDIGDSATWLTGGVGAFMAVDANTLYAFVNGASRALYKTTDGGTIWTSLSSLPFDVDPGGVSGHPDGRILIANRDAGAQMLAYADSPGYSSWTNATGSPAFPTAGGGARAAIWVV